ncbi:uncharacterized protein LOC120431830 [Culex pipiens pallens]|uniref:uncharacterized protein LOC120431830 n=1 Tax=Culex pipiens pallens TaxID=42434 RepID=UPI0022AB09D9|nr:uncharacterized protein LOC120431830 [Culex pipiens pallens]
MLAVAERCIADGPGRMYRGIEVEPRFPVTAVPFTTNALSCLSSSQHSHPGPVNRTRSGVSRALLSDTSGRTHQGSEECPRPPYTVESSQRSSPGVSTSHQSRPDPVYGHGSGGFRPPPTGEYNQINDSSPTLNHQSLQQPKGMLSFFTVYYQNAGGMRTKTKQFFLALAGNNLFRQDRNELTCDRSRGGGVLIAVKKAHDFTCTCVLSAGYEHLEQVAVRIKARNHTVYVCCIYIRPNSPPDVYTSHGTAVQELVDLSSNDDSIIVTGDYNLPHLAWTFDVDVNCFIPLNASTEQELALTENVVATGLLQICSLANVNGRILDLARGNEDAEPDFSRCDFDRVTESLSSIDWDDILQDQDSNTSTTIFYDVLYEIVRQFVPSKRVSRNRTEKLPWWNADLRNRRNILRKARKRLFKAGTPENQTAVDRLEIEYELLQDSLFRDYLNRVQVDLKDNPSSFWKYVRSRKRTCVLPTRISLNSSTAENPEDAANVFADFFSSVYEADAPSASTDYLNDLPTYDIYFPQPEFSQADVKSTLDAVDPSKGAGPDRLPPSFIKRLSEHLAKPVSVIFNRSLSEGTFPDEWKLAAITPIHKTGSTTAAENYRPISILSCLPNVFEVLIHEGMYAAAQIVISEFQHGFVKKRSTVSNLMAYVSALNKNLEKFKQIDAIYFDFAKAFDKVPHTLIIAKQKPNLEGVTGQTKVKDRRDTIKNSEDTGEGAINTVVSTMEGKLNHVSVA